MPKCTISPPLPKSFDPALISIMDTMHIQRHYNLYSMLLIMSHTNISLVMEILLPRAKDVNAFQHEL
eukprot:8511164-Ditylum_brightwellii.AAC.1